MPVKKKKGSCPLKRGFFAEQAASPALCKLNQQLLAQGYANAVEEAELLTQMTGKCGYRKGPVSESQADANAREARLGHVCRADGDMGD